MSCRSTISCRRIGPYASLALLGMMSCSTVMAQAPIVKIEEDWELQVLQPDEQLDAPQLTTTMLPFGPSSDLLFQADWNHASIPSFANGGFQLRIGTDGDCLEECHDLRGQRLHVSEEVVRWTQVVSKVGSGYSFSVINGHGESWGSFGGASTAIVLADQEVDGDLSRYRVADSLAHSGVTYAGNRVACLRLNRVRFQDSLGQQWEVSVQADVQ